jgi:hypothetical protein
MNEIVRLPRRPVNLEERDTARIRKNGNEYLNATACGNGNADGRPATVRPSMLQESFVNAASSNRKILET